MPKKETKEITVSPKWNIIWQDVKDLVSDFLWGSAAFATTTLIEYLNVVDLNAVLPPDQVTYGGLVVGFLVTFFSRVLKKIKKQSNYDN